MSLWKIVITDRARAQIDDLDKSTALRIDKYLRGYLPQLPDPRSAGKALSGSLSGCWRYRVGSYRIICKIKDDVLTILVVAVGSRDKIYKREISEI